MKIQIKRQMWDKSDRRGRLLWFTIAHPHVVGGNWGRSGGGGARLPWAWSEHVGERVAQLQQIVGGLGVRWLRRPAEQVDDIPGARRRRQERIVHGGCTRCRRRDLRLNAIKVERYRPRSPGDSDAHTLYWFIAASSSARAWALIASSMPFACCSKRADAAAVPNDELVEDRADTPLFMFFWLLLFWLWTKRIHLENVYAIGICTTVWLLRRMWVCVCVCTGFNDAFASDGPVCLACGMRIEIMFI